MLGIAEFAYNNLKHASAKISTFYANYGFEPRTSWPMEIQFRYPASESYSHYMNSVHKDLKELLEVSVEAMGRNYNQRRKSIEPLKKGELVMLTGRNIRGKHRCKKQEDKML
jgi:hypothetical protein